MKRYLFFLSVFALILSSCEPNEPSFSTNYLQMAHSTVGKSKDDAIAILTAKGLEFNYNYEGDSGITGYICCSKDSTFTVGIELYLQNGIVAGYSIGCVLEGEAHKKEAQKMLIKWSDYAYNTIFSSKTCWSAEIYTFASGSYGDIAYEPDHSLYFAEGPCLTDDVEITFGTHKDYSKFLNKELNLNEQDITEEYSDENADIFGELSAWGQHNEYTINFTYPYNRYLY